MLGLAGIGWGLPARWHPDEKADAAARMLQERTAAPESFVNPSLPLYLMMPALVAQRAAARLGVASSRALDPLLAGRALSALAGALAVLLLGRRGGPHGPVAALLLAVAPGVVNLCHFATPEAWLILGATATLVLAMSHAEGGAPAWALGLALGLTASTKYTAAALLAPALAAVWLRPRVDERTRAWPFAACAAALALAAAMLRANADGLASQLRLRDARLLLPGSGAGFLHGLEHAAWLAAIALGVLAVLAWRGGPRGAALARPGLLVVALCAAGGFLLGTPYALRAPIAFLSDLAFNQQTRHEYKGLVGASSSYLPYARLLAGALTWPVLLLALGGVASALRRARTERAALVPVLALAAPYLMVASSGHQAMRFLAPALPAAALVAAGALGLLPPRARRPALVLVAAQSAVVSLLVVRLFFVDARLRAAGWLEARTPPGETIDVIANDPGYAPSASGRTMRIVPTLSREMAPADRFQEAAARYPAEASRWLVLTASFYERFLEHPEQRPERTAFFEDLLAGRGGFEVAARFRQNGWLRPQAEFVDPEVVVLRRRDGPAQPPPVR